jgi:hypothetical protein
MLKPRLIITVLAAGFLYGIFHLFALRFATGDVYPAYSSLRADPVGLKGFHDALDDLPQLDVRRNYRPLERLQLPAPPTLIYAGTAHYAVWQDNELHAAEGLLTDGARIVIAFYPVTRAPRSDDDPSKENGTKKKAPPGRQKKTNAPTKDEAKTPTDSSSNDETEPEEEEPAAMLSFRDVATRWGFSFHYLPGQIATFEDKAPAATAVLESDAPPQLEKKISWHSRLSFIPDAAEWNVIYRCEGEPVVIERNYNRGSIVLAADSFFLSNEALRVARAPALLEWLLGDARVVVFDEESHNIRAEPGLMQLARKYRLHGLGAGLVLLAFLFVWKNSSPLVPPFPESDDASAAVAGKRAEEGFVNLLRRSIPQRELVRLCAEEWRRTFDPKHHDARAEEVVRAARENTAVVKRARARDVVAAYREICRRVAAEKIPSRSS